MELLYLARDQSVFNSFIQLNQIISMIYYREELILQGYMEKIKLFLFGLISFMAKFILQKTKFMKLVNSHYLLGKKKQQLSILGFTHLSQQKKQQSISIFFTIAFRIICRNNYPTLQNKQIILLRYISFGKVIEVGEIDFFETESTIRLSNQIINQKEILLQGIAISINLFYKNDITYFILNRIIFKILENQEKFLEVIECQDLAILINPQHYSTYVQKVVIIRSVIFFQSCKLIKQIQSNYEVQDKVIMLLLHVLSNKFFLIRKHFLKYVNKCQHTSSQKSEQIAFSQLRKQKKKKTQLKIQKIIFTHCARLLQQQVQKILPKMNERMVTGPNILTNLTQVLNLAIQLLKKYVNDVL